MNRYVCVNISVCPVVPALVHVSRGLTDRGAIRDCGKPCFLLTLYSFQSRVILAWIVAIVTDVWPSYAIHFDVLSILIILFHV